VTWIKFQAARSGASSTGLTGLRLAGLGLYDAERALHPARRLFGLLGVLCARVFALLAIFASNYACHL
jgi:hypothetical protein